MPDETPPIPDPIPPELAAVPLLPEEPTPGAIELEIRYEFTLRLFRKALEKGTYTKGEIKRALKKQFGISPRTCENYLREARRRYAEERDMTRDEEVERSLGFYEGIVSNDRIEPGTRIRARERMDKLLCIEKPAEVKHSGTVGLQHGNMAAAAADLRRFLFENPGAEIRLDKAHANGAAATNGDGHVRAD
jgi:hypothetical protein